MPNALIHETSPYLLQHANNPVDWYPWNDETLTKAKEENKLILVSIGYAACHWCHVMEHESFEDEEVAELMNKHFICVKVDREERPDIDKIYMDAVMLLTGRGGWPLNAIALPDGKPFFGGTYFPKDHWMQVLNQVAELNQNEPDKVIYHADHLVTAMKDLDKVILKPDTTGISRADVSTMMETWLDQIDFKWGGRLSQGNKFPLPMNNLFLLRAATLLQDARIQEAADITLEKMAFGGIYDHLGGGFSRYSVDGYWKVPHFEKMLYDNGQLVSLYAEAWQQNPKDVYKRAVYQTLNFIERELTSPEGGFYASLDADSEGEEGKFYTWQYEEVEKVLGSEAKLFADYYNIHPFGNWEGKNVLFVLESEEEFANRWKLEVSDFKQKMETGRKQLFEVRKSKIRPGLDDKILSSWNALMLKGYVDAYRVFGEERFLEAALRNADFLQSKMIDEDGRLYRNYKEGKRTIPGFLDDYTYLIDALIALYQVSFEEKWLTLADELLDFVFKHFSDEATKMFFFTSDEGDVLVRRKMEVQDDVNPASNSTLACSLYTLSLLLYKPVYKARAEQMLANVKKEVIKSPAWHAQWSQLVLRQTFPHYEVAITGKGANQLRRDFETHYYPNRIFAGAESESEVPILENRMTDEATIYVCEGNACQLPVHTVKDALEQMKTS